MPDAFVIMQIGNDELDRVCDDHIFAAINGAGLQPRRVDRHNRGDLLKAEIITFLEESEIIIADLTNERPNCYLEIGYAMGLGKKMNLILTAREDHFPSSPNHRADGPKIHFDLQGYDILRWSIEDLPEFERELQERITRRRRLLSPPANLEEAILRQTAGAVPEWIVDSRTAAINGLNSTGFSSYWEASSPIEPKGSWSRSELRNAVRISTIDTFGWPIGLEFENREGAGAVPTAEGIRAEIAFPKTTDGHGQPSYDYWSISKQGDFYTLRSLFEDSRGAPNEIYFETRIVQVTELLLFLSRLYQINLGLALDSRVRIELTHGGIQGRVFGTVERRFVRRGMPNTQPSVTTVLTCTVDELVGNITTNVSSLLDEVFQMFDFNQVSLPIFEEIVSKFVRG